jgi:hypothetical protein
MDSRPFGCLACQARDDGEFLGHTETADQKNPKTQEDHFHDALHLTDNQIHNQERV